MAPCWWAAAPLLSAQVSVQSPKCWRAKNICDPWTTGVWIETLPWAPHSFIPLSNTRSKDKYQIKEGYFSSSLLKDSCDSACSEILLSFVAAVEFILPIWMGSCFRSAQGRILLLLFIITGSQLCSDWLDRFENPWILIIFTSDVSLSFSPVFRSTITSIWVLSDALALRLQTIIVHF